MPQNDFQLPFQAHCAQAIAQTPSAQTPIFLLHATGRLRVGCQARKRKRHSKAKGRGLGLDRRPQRHLHATSPARAHAAGAGLERHRGGTPRWPTGLPYAGARGRGSPGMGTGIPDGAPGAHSLHEIHIPCRAFNFSGDFAMTPGLSAVMKIPEAAVGGQKGGSVAAT